MSSTFSFVSAFSSVAESACLYINILFMMLQSKTHVVLATLRRSPEELSSHHPKMFKVDDHLGVAVSGLNSDGRSLSRYMRTETLNHRSFILPVTNFDSSCQLSTMRRHLHCLVVHAKYLL